MHNHRNARRATTSKTTALAKSLRQSMTPAERFLWAHLRRNALDYHFRRQAPIGRYVLDFYCAKAKLAIEVDGDVHFDKLDRDLERTNWLETHMGIRVLRVTNQQVLENIEGVIIFLLQELASAPSLPSPAKKIT
jgi:very-short-patch-repair endonuclease